MRQYLRYMVRIDKIMFVAEEHSRTCYVVCTCIYYT